MSLAKTRKLVYETMVALSQGKISIDHCFAIAKLAEAECHLVDKETHRLELALAHGYAPLDYTDAMEVISTTSELLS
jgi:hypothetical protein